MRVKLEDIVEGMEMQSDDNRSFLNLDTGEIVHISQEALLIAEDSEDYEHLSEWQQDEVKIALDIVESFGKYAALLISLVLYREKNQEIKKVAVRHSLQPLNNFLDKLHEKYQALRQRERF